MKRMKTLLLGWLAFLVAFCVGFGFVGCDGETVDEHSFLSAKELEKVLIPNLPKLPYGENTRTTYNQFFCNLTYEEYQQYVEQVYEYLSSCNFNYFGTEGRSTGWHTRQLEQSQEISDFYERWDSNQCMQASFVWGNKIETYKNGDGAEYKLAPGYYLEIFYYDFPQKRDRFSNFNYNVQIDLDVTLGMIYWL